MNKKEKRLVEKIKNKYNSTNKEPFSSEENKMIDRFIVNGILNKEAFIDTTSYADTHKIFLQGIAYPFTPLGEKEINRHWYLEFRNNIWIVVIRDFLGAVAFIISLILAMTKILQSN